MDCYIVIWATSNGGSELRLGSLRFSTLAAGALTLITQLPPSSVGRGNKSDSCAAYHSLLAQLVVSDFICSRWSTSSFNYGMLNQCRRWISHFKMSESDLRLYVNDLAEETYTESPFS